MTKSARRLGAIGLLATLALVLTPTPAGAVGRAQASVAVSCNGQVNPVNATGTATRQSYTLPPGDGRTLTLRSGNVGGHQYAWSRISSSVNGDKIWIDITGEGVNPKHWTQCDLRTLGTTRNYTNGLPTVNNSLVCMRAGFRANGADVSYLTPWWC